MNGFIPDTIGLKQADVPFFEDQGEQKIPGRGTEKTQENLKDEIISLMAKLGAGGVLFIQGTYPGEMKRYGFQIQFNINGIPGRVDVAALPMKSETALKKDRALAQALYLIRNWLEAEHFSAVYRPGTVALLPYLIGEGGQTLTEAIIAGGKLPLLVSGGR